MKVKYVAYSICDCGFPILRDGIPLGAIYEIDPNNKSPVTVICGGCKKWIRSTGVWVHAKGGRHGGYLPEQIFEPLHPVTSTTNQGKEPNEKEH